MNCRQAKADIALWVGEDLQDAQQKEELRRHLASCPECRAHYKRMKRTFAVLERADRDATYDSSDSLWPHLAQRISRHSAGSPGRFNGWLPFAAMTAACAILVIVMDARPPAQVHRAPMARSIGLPSFPTADSTGAAPELRTPNTPTSQPPARPEQDVRRIFDDVGTF